MTTDKENRLDGENTQSGRDGYKSYNKEGITDTIETKAEAMDVVRMAATGKVATPVPFLLQSPF